MKDVFLPYIPKLLRTLAFLLVIAWSPLFSQGIVINEFMSSNLNTIADEDGDFPDWIELYNASPDNISLGGYSLSDNPDRPQKWVFPDIDLAPGQFLLVFASGKDRKRSDHLETILRPGDIWRYRLGTSEPPSDWRTVGFADSSWASGPAGIGYGDDDDQTVIDPVISFYMRHTFDIADINQIEGLQLHIDYDDAFVAYLNGQEIQRENLGAAGGLPPPYFVTANSDREPNLINGLPPARFSSSEPAALLQTGMNTLAIQVHNVNSASSDMSMIPFLTLGFSSAPSASRGLDATIEPYLTKMHSGFRIKAEGEPLILSDATGVIVDEVAATDIPPGISYGRQPDGDGQWVFFEKATPDSSNNDALSFSAVTNPPRFTAEGGFYNQPLSVAISANHEREVIHYTTDGAEPTLDAPKYDGPVLLDQTTVLRARAFAHGTIPGEGKTTTYFIRERSTLPVLSLATAPKNLWSDEAGIYILGPNASSTFPYFGANYWKDWERPVHIELYENQQLAFDLQAGIQIAGGGSRTFAQKSLSVFTRAQYGDGDLEYPLFEHKDIDVFEGFLLRNSGNDWFSTMLRDAFIQHLVADTDIDVQAYQPAIVYLNGQYWGIHNIREKINEHYVAGNHNVDADNIDMLENGGIRLAGTNTHYLALLNFVNSNDMSLAANYEHVKARMDMDNYLSYQVAQIYIDNTDWPHRNIKYWRPQTANGRWRWIMFDTDSGFGLRSATAYTSNSLDRTILSSGSFLLRNLLLNNIFRNELINRFATHMNREFHPDRAVALLDSLQQLLAPEIERHLTLWETGSYDAWLSRLNRMRTFARQRPTHMENHIVEYFGLSGASNLTVNILPENAGSIEVDSLSIEASGWSGRYFNDIPLRVVAKPHHGYRFAGWEDGFISTRSAIRLSLMGDLTITARFEALPRSTDIVINELNYNSAPDFDPEDWVEFYNRGDLPVDMSSWVLTDGGEGNTFHFPTETVLQPDSYLVVCRDTTAFDILFPEVGARLGDLDFGFSSSGEAVFLFDSNGDVADSLTYEDESPWPQEADGDGPTLALKDPWRDNALPQNWQASLNNGTPGAFNDFADRSSLDSENPLSDFYLRQNFPNPFNPQTHIRFELAKANVVTVEVYDLLGRRIAELVKGRLAAGQYELTWTPEDGLSGGIYFLRFSIDKQLRATQKLIYLK